MNEKKKYVAPEIEICVIDCNDIVLISNENTEGTPGKINYDD